MIPDTLDITLYRGGTYDQAFTADDPTFLFTRYDGARMQIRKRFLDVPSGDAEAPILDITTDNGGIVLTDTMLTLNITAADTASISTKKGVYGIELYYDNSGTEVVDKFLRGEIYVEGEATIVYTI